MPAFRKLHLCATAFTVLGLLTLARMANAQDVTRMGDPNKPVNDLPNPYRTERNVWGVLVAPMDQEPAVAAVVPAPNGTFYLVERCFENNCYGRKEAPILKLDKDGHLLKSWGVGMFVFPHAATVDSENNLYVTDALGQGEIGQQVLKFSPEGKLLLALGKAGVAGNGPDTFDRPDGVAIAPNGDIFIADGHNDATNSRIVVFSQDGKFIRTFGQKGSRPGDLHEPHSICFDSQGRLFVADRLNNRIEIFTQEGKFIAEWYQFGRPSGVFITKDDTLYVADSESGPELTTRHEIPGWKKGIRIGSAKTGQVTAFIEDLESTTPLHSGPEDVSVDADGIVYGAMVRRRMLERFIKIDK